MNGWVCQKNEWVNIYLKYKWMNIYNEWILKLTNEVSEWKDELICIKRNNEYINRIKELILLMN